MAHLFFLSVILFFGGRVDKAEGRSGPIQVTVEIEGPKEESTSLLIILHLRMNFECPL